LFVIKAGGTPGRRIGLVEFVMEVVGEQREKDLVADCGLWTSVGLGPQIGPKIGGDSESFPAPS
jgi:hypothetical protein